MSTDLQFRLETSFFASGVLEFILKEIPDDLEEFWSIQVSNPKTPTESKLKPESVKKYLAEKALQL